MAGRLGRDRARRVVKSDIQFIFVVPTHYHHHTIDQTKKKKKSSINQSINQQCLAFSRPLLSLSLCWCGAMCMMPSRWPATFVEVRSGRWTAAPRCCG